MKRAGGGELLLIEEEAHRAKPTGRPSAEQEPNLDSLKTGVLMVFEMSSPPCLRLVNLNKDRTLMNPQLRGKHDVVRLGAGPVNRVFG